MAPTYKVCLIHRGSTNWEKRELLRRWNIWDSAHIAANHTQNKQTESDNKSSEHGTSSARVHYVWNMCVMIHFLTTKLRTTAEIHRELVQMYEKNCIDVLNVQRWKKDFENNHCVSLEDEQYSGWRTECLTIDNNCRMCESFKAYNCFTLD